MVCHKTSEGEVMIRTAAICCAALIGAIVPVAASAAGGPPKTSCGLVVQCEVDETAANVELLPREAVVALEKFPGDDGKPIVDRANEAPRYEYLSLNDCPQAKPDS